MRRLFIPLFVTLVVHPAAAADRTFPAVPLAIDGRGGVAVDVRINDHGPFRFLIDTGASRSIVSEDLARQLRAPVVAKSEVVTSAGSEMRLVVRLASVALPFARAEALLAPTVPGVRLAELGHGVRGLLGQDFLSAFNYTLDYRRRLLTRDEAIVCDTPDAVPMNAAEGRFVMALRARSGRALRLVPDSGAEIAVLFRGRSPVPALSALQIGSVTLRDVPAVVVDREDANADGLLPLHRFSSVSFGAGGSCVIARK